MRGKNPPTQRRAIENGRWLFITTPNRQNQWEKLPDRMNQHSINTDGQPQNIDIYQLEARRRNDQVSSPSQPNVNVNRYITVESVGHIRSGPSAFDRLSVISNKKQQVDGQMQMLRGQPSRPVKCRSGDPKRNVNRYNVRPAGDNQSIRNNNNRPVTSPENINQAVNKKPSQHHSRHQVGQQAKSNESFLDCNEGQPPTSQVQQSRSIKMKVRSIGEVN